MIWPMHGEGKTVSDGFTFSLQRFLISLSGKVFMCPYNRDHKFSPFTPAWLPDPSGSRLLLDMPAAPWGWDVVSVCG